MGLKRGSHARWWRRLLVWLGEYQLRHPTGVYIITAALPFAVPLLYSFCGEWLGLTDSLHLTPWGYVLLGLCSACIVISEMAARAVESAGGTLEDAKKTITVLADLNKNTREICDSKLRTLSEILGVYVREPERIPPQIVSDPKRQLTTIAHELEECLGSLLWPKESLNQLEGEPKLFVSVLCNFLPGNEGWHWGTKAGDIDISELMKKRGKYKSTVMTLLKNNEYWIFENSKQDAYERKQYVRSKRDKQDEDGKIPGSIACFRDEIKDDTNDEVLIDFVISITSYTRRFIEPYKDWEHTRDRILKNVRDVIMPVYLTRTGIELCLSCLEHLHKERTNKEERKSLPAG